MEEREQVTASPQFGVALYLAGRRHAAAEVLERALAESPDNPDAWRCLAAALWQSDQREKAIEALRSAAAACPDEPRLWRDLAAALDLTGAWQKALYAVAERLVLDPEDDAAQELSDRLEAVPERQAAAAEAERARAVLERPEASDEERLEAMRRLLSCHDPGVLRWLLRQDPPLPVTVTLVRRLGALAVGELRRAVPPPVGQVPFLVGALGRLSPRLAREMVDKLLDDPEPEVRAAALGVVLRLLPRVPDQYLDPLVKALGDRDEAIRERLAEGLGPALTALAEAGRPVQPVLAALYDTDGHPALAAAESWLAAASWCDTPVAEGLLQRVLGGADAALIDRVMAGVVEARGEELLRQVYASGDSTARRYALDGFAALGTTELLALGLWDDEADLRAASAVRLGESGEDEAVGPLRERLEAEANEAVRAALEKALAQLEAREDGESGEVGK